MNSLAKDIVLATQTYRGSRAVCATLLIVGGSVLSVAQAQTSSERNLEEVIVSAQKREERLQDVPVPVEVITAGALAETNQLKLQDYFARVPGMNFQSGSRGEPIISIRGINSLGNPTVGVMIDDVPYGPTLFRGGGFTAPDIDPSDLQRIEVLRGPQGTLYGVNSLGGLIKYVTVSPTTDKLTGSAQLGSSSVHGGDDIGYNARGTINVPLSDSFAVRASAFTRLEPGYIDNPGAGLQDVNESDASGGRLSALYAPSESLSVKLTALYQERNMDGASLAAPALGVDELKQNYLKGSGWVKTQVQAYAANVSARFGSVELASLTGFNINRFNSSIDVSPFYSTFANASFGVTGVPYVEDYEAEKVTQELRLSVPLTDTIEWLVGAFYTDEKFTRARTDILASNTATGAVVGTLSRGEGNGGYEEYAAFTNLTVQFTDRFDVQVGGRFSHNSQDYSEIDTGVPTFVAGGRLVIPNSEIDESPVTYLLTPRLRVSPDLMVYARLASGYRAGGININAARGFAVPPGFDSDKTYNYEIGAKGNLFDQLVTFDAAAFYIDWKDLQVNFRSVANYQDNASRARSRGVELSLDVRPVTGMQIGTNMTYNNAELTEGFGSTSPFLGRPGDELPFTSEFAGSLSIDQEFPFAGGWVGFAGGLVTYVGERKGLFQRTALRQEYPAFTQVDLHAGAELDSWRASVYVTNVADKRGLVGGGIGQTNPSLFNYIQPRTLGVSVSKDF